MDTATEALPPKEKICDKELIKKMTDMFGNTTLTVMVAPLMLGSMLPKVKETDPEVYWGAISETRKFVDTLKKGITEFEETLSKLTAN
jgi:hypothetical protein